MKKTIDLTQVSTQRIIEGTIRNLTLNKIVKIKKDCNLNIKLPKIELTDEQLVKIRVEYTQDNKSISIKRNEKILLDDLNNKNTFEVIYNKADIENNNLSFDIKINGATININNINFKILNQKDNQNITVADNIVACCCGFSHELPLCNCANLTATA
ncbi:MAG: hypothetical protein IPK18_06820 [Sphingobacteriales bacterium]|jgi:hypothetical protein|nr:MAG: hypothetical protein IPK18_06820 [Sphingobacteriales bacterium]